MNKQDLINVIAEAANISKTAAETAVNTMTQSVTDTLAKGDKVSIIGFGNWEVGKRAARKGRNPRTGEEINIAARNTIKFKAGKGLVEAVN